MQGSPDVLLVKPDSFQFNCETGGDNVFMAKEHGLEGVTDTTAQALSEFASLLEHLESSGVKCHVFEPLEDTPDAVFPNNWFSVDTEKDTVVYYPMMAQSRRRERNNVPIRSFLTTRYKRVLDLTHFEEQAKYLEGTGSLCLDRTNKIAYMCVSQRSNIEVANEWAKAMEYSLVSFKAEAGGLPVYHTNVVMSIGTNMAVLCTAAVVDKEEQRRLLSSLEKTGKKVVEITLEQMNMFCGNVLEVSGAKGPVLAMSHTAWCAFSKEQLHTFEQCGINSFVHPEVRLIEKLGGGSVRCMIAEVF